MSQRNYRVEVAETSKEVSAKARVQLKDTTNCVGLDRLTQENPDGVLIEPDFYAVLNIHNENSDDKDYQNFIIVAKDGKRYSTGSLSFWNSFLDIMDDMAGIDEPWKLKVYRMPSKNRQGKDFLTCSVE